MQGNSLQQTPLAASASLTLIPAFINLGSGSANIVLKHLQADKRLRVYEILPKDLPDALEKEVKAGTTRVLICGGDGTLALAASKLVNTNTAMAVLPGGTLNHFAGNLGIPTDVAAAVEIAVNSQNLQAVDVGYVNDQLFLNTSSVGAYVRFVRTREHLEKRMSYRLASVLAGLRRLLRLRSSRLFIDGVKIRSPLAFIGVRERELSFPALGQERSDGQHGLHMIVITVSGRMEMLWLAFNAMFRGIDPLQKAKQVENRMVESVEVDNIYRKRGLYVAVDGELTLQKTPLRYRYERDALLVVTP